MERHIRLAHFRGLLHGRRLSPAAVRAADYMSIMEVKDNVKEFGRRLRLSMLSYKPTQDRLRTLFPEMFNDDEGKEKVEFRQTTPEQIMQALSALQGSGEIEVHGDEGWV